MDSCRKSFESSHAAAATATEEQPIRPDDGEVIVKMDGDDKSGHEFWNAADDIQLDFSLAADHNQSRHRQHPVAETSDNEIKNSSSSSSSVHGRDGGAAFTSESSFRRSPTLLRSRTRSRLMDALPHPAPQGEKPRSGLLGRPAAAVRVDEEEEDEEDPFMDEDVPDYGFRRAKLSAWTVVQWAGLLVISAALGCGLAVPELRRRALWGLALWKWEALVLALICGRLVSGWAIRLAVFFIERSFMLRKRVLYFVYGVRRAVQNCLWLGLVLLTWQLVFDPAVERGARSTPLSYVSKALLCLLVATLFRLAKTLLLKVLASSFHVSTYFDRIQDSLFNQHIIATLSGPPLVAIQHVAQASNRKEGGWETEGIPIEHLHRLNQKNVSAWKMKRLIKMVRHGTLSTLDEQIPQQGYSEDESATQIRNEFEAKVAAKKIFHNVAQPGSKFIYLADLMRLMTQEEALKAIALFEGVEENNRVSKRSLKNWVVSAFRERQALALTLNDTKTAVHMLHQMANVIVGIVVFALWLLILGLATTHIFVFISSQLLVVVFIFGNTLKTIFEAIIFLFVMHPFDVGDRCEVEGVQMIVEEMNILTTIFLRYDNQKITYPNSVLATLPISNIYRSPDMGESIDFCVHVATAMEKIAVMKERIIGFIEARKDHWYPNPSVVLRDVDDMNRLKISVWLQHRINYQNMGERWRRRELVVQEMIKVLRELDIEYRMLPLDINVRQLPELSSTRLPSTWKTSA